MIGDMNADKAINNQDIATFVLGLTNPAGYAGQFPDIPLTLVGDINGDGVFNNQDIAPFVALLTSGKPAAASEPPPLTASPRVSMKAPQRSPFASGRTLELMMDDGDRAALIGSPLHATR
jgi:hypothetical protein